MPMFVRREGVSWNQTDPGLKPSSATYWLNDLGIVTMSLFRLSFLFIDHLKNKIPTDSVSCYENYTKSSAEGVPPLTGNRAGACPPGHEHQMALVAFGVGDRRILRHCFWNLILFASSKASVCDHPYPPHQTGPGSQRTPGKMHPLPPCAVQSAGSLGHLEASYPVGPPTALACVFLTPFLLRGSPAGEGRVLMEGA